ncbi:MAG: squalene synthase HpnC [Betaproteobacteria bacterium]|nr:squalene synthase HpnC [Betaproteobacteria bacterium]MDE2048543.1 squalene synthase HpnC [Betaproteobacteria bacterium]
MTVDHYENFPVASWLCPRRIRPAIQAIYAFARSADDIADEGTLPEAERLRQLAHYRDALRATFGGTPPADGPWPALHRAIVAHDLPAQPFLDLLSAFEQDVTTVRYRNFDHLLDYTRRSANPVGRLLLHLYGVKDARSAQQSDAICTALQLINFWQDVAIDRSKNPPRGRIYLPLDSLAKYGIGEMQVLRGRMDANFSALLAYECRRARDMMLRGAPLVHALPGRIGWELRLVVQGGLRVLHKLERADYDVFAHRPVLGRLDAVVMLARAIVM